MVKAKYTHWITDEGLEKLKVLVKLGLADKAIANEIGISVSTLYAWYDRFPEVEHVIVCKGKNDIEYSFEKPNGKKRYKFYRNGEEVKYCRLCDEFSVLREYIEGAYSCKGCQREKTRAYRKTDGGKTAKSLYAKKYYKENKQEVYKMVYKRHNKIKNTVFDYSNDDWENTIIEFDMSCAYCGVESENLQREHVIPVSKGGYYVKSNIIPACRRCNMSKLDKDMEAWYINQSYFCSIKLSKIKKWNTVEQKQLALF